ncbi:DEAD/DEAH box helicase family protein [Microbacterium sp. NPDC089987]|uniref:DEAD/DEAH box helicase family protein n=1 Tax=Microbacterium sp. NPDC089987 TaxID=3364202 RepID=UPI00381E1342
MPSLLSRPLAHWRFDGELRTYQAEALRSIPADPADSAMHVVAPPGSGKTLLGLLLAARVGHRALVLAPSVTIRDQWVRTARDLAHDVDAVSDDPAELKDLTVLTYQRLSVTGDSSPFDELASRQWLDELTASGRTASDAATWLATLSVDNPAQHARGIRSRASALRRRFSRARPDEIARALHPNAIALIDRVVEAGVDTVVLDECHHLLDHWALVVAYLRSRIRASGGTGLLIGLTATLPSPDDETGFDNYSQLLGDVDYEVPTPAVVKEGHLAPYRARVWFTEPVPQEADFIRRSEAQLHELVTQVLSSPDGLGFLVDQLQPTVDDQQTADDSASSSDERARRDIDRALSADFPLATACGSVLRAVAPGHPLAVLLEPSLFGRPSTDDLLQVLARFALDRLLADPDAHPQWRFLKGALADFGLHLTDRGLRRGRDPVESTLAASVAKDHAAVEIIRHELSAADGERVRAVVVTDVVESGNTRGLTGDAAPGVLRIFEMLAADPITAALSPVLLTGEHLRTTATAAHGVADALSRLLGTPVEVKETPGATRRLGARGVSGSGLVAAVSHLVADGTVRLLVGTRGLLGEGWDCPAVNTLVDLTTVATSTATQQLRGRTLRLDPAWPEKVAHNWSVVCLIPPHVSLDDRGEIERLRRRHGHLWGLSADDHSEIVSGLGTVLAAPERALLSRVIGKDRQTSVAALNAAVLAAERSRAQTRADWRIGETLPAREREALAVRSARRRGVVQLVPALTAGTSRTFALSTLASGAALALASGPLALHLPLLGGLGAALGAGALFTLVRRGEDVRRALRLRRDPARVHHLAAVTVARALHSAGRIAALPDEAIAVTAQPLPDGSTRVRLLFEGPPQTRRVLADAVQELFGPVRTPRFVLRVGARERTYLAVPQQIGRRRADAEDFAALWRQTFGGGELIELKGAEGLVVLRAARAQHEAIDSTAPRHSVWC